MCLDDINVCDDKGSLVDDTGQVVERKEVDVTRIIFPY